jgi:ABC-type proline/glycine betaine transport system permease subunit
MHSFFLHLSIADWVNDVVQSFVTQYGDSFHNFSIALLRYLLVPLEGALRATPPWLILLVVGAITWNATRRIGIAGFFVLLRSACRSASSPRVAPGCGASCFRCSTSCRRCQASCT